MSMHVEWLSLIEISGAFLAEPILDQAFPQGLEGLETSKKQAFRQTYEEWREALDTGDELQAKLHQEWINWVLKTGLEWDEDDEAEELKAGVNVPADLKLELLEHNLTLKPDYALFGSDANKPYLLVTSYPAHIELTEVVAGDGWSTTPAERMSHLCRATGTRLGLVTNGEQWMIVDAPEGGITSYASWYARLWSQEPVTLKAFFSLLNIRTVFSGFGLEAKKLTELLDDSLKHQDEVTETLGAQVQRAVEVLIQSIDRINNDANGELLKGVEPTELYEAGLTYMMRLVFLLCAEERGLLLLGDETYEANYAVSTLRMKLREEAGLHGEEVLSYRNNAWARLLAVFRAVYGGVEHEGMRMPALGGSLFDPDRFPFLEGRSKDSSWKIDEARPLPIDNRTVLLFLDAIQLYQGRTLSYRALDVEQIGYVYEGLLERTVIRSTDVTLELDSTKSAKKPWLLLGELESAKLDGTAAVNALLRERTGSSASRITNDLARETSEAESEKLLLACQNDAELRDRIKPYYHFLRVDAWTNPMIYTKGAYMVATGADRRETGTHYTPKSLTEAIVLETLEPIVYIGPSEGKERGDWQLKSPAQLLALKICDPAMGSGAFLVQVCRYLSERLGEAWALAEESGKSITAEGQVVDVLTSQDRLPKDSEERQVIARRLVAEHCLYGVDVNPLAVELAKLAIWLVTLSKGRPFGFLDHNLKAGNSLLGIHNLDQLYYLDMQPEGMAAGGGAGKQLFAQGIEKAVKEALKLREEIRNRPVRDIRDVEVMEHLNQKAQSLLTMPELISDALIGEALVAADKPANLKSALTRLSVAAGEALNNPANAQALNRKTNGLLATDVDCKIPRKPFHWPLAFPEVFGSDSAGFDAIVGNVPFLGGQRLTAAFGNCFRDYLVMFVARGERGSADLAAYFFLKIYSLLGVGGSFGLLSTNTIAQGDTRLVGLDLILGKDAIIYAAYPNEVWPGKAVVVTSRVHIRKGHWAGNIQLDGQLVTYISSYLSERAKWTPKKLKKNSDQSFQGSNLLGLGFIVTEAQALALVKLDPKNRDVIYPYLNGKDFNTHPLQSASRWAINFFDWPEVRAQRYAEPFKLVTELVKPERDKLNQGNSDGRRRKTNWWKYGRDSIAMYHSVGRGDLFEKHPKGWTNYADKQEYVLIRTITCKHPVFEFVSNNMIFDQTNIVFSRQSFVDYVILNSNIHNVWAVNFGPTLTSNPRYTSQSCFETFPKPEIIFPEKVQELGRECREIRIETMSSMKIGLTKLYNLFHDPENTENTVVEMRHLHQKIDEAVASAYGWDDLDLEHDFHAVDYLPENDRVRFTISEKARNEVLDRLTVLNKERHHAEQKELGVVRLPKKSTKYKMAASDSELDKVAEPKPQMSFFDDTGSAPELTPVKTVKGNQWGAESIDQILAWLEDKAPNWYTKEAILTACGASVADWQSAIGELLNDGDIESKIVDSISRYRATE
jgi:hypothetical protein